MTKEQKALLRTSDVITLEPDQITTSEMTK